MEKPINKLIEEFPSASDNQLRSGLGNIILSIETAIRGGSISLLRGGTEIDFWVGQSEISKSEDILDEIKKILEKNEVDKKSIKLLLFSNGPGSFTGIRIGAATALGLRRSLKCNFAGVSVLESMAVLAALGQTIITAVPLGREQVCWQLRKKTTTEKLETDALQEPRVSNISAFAEELNTQKFESLILHNFLFDTLINNRKTIFNGLQKNKQINKQKEKTKGVQVINAGDNLARFIGMTGGASKQKKAFVPIYARRSAVKSNV